MLTKSLLRRAGSCGCYIACWERAHSWSPHQTRPLLRRPLRPYHVMTTTTTTTTSAKAVVLGESSPTSVLDLVPDATPSTDATTGIRRSARKRTRTRLFSAPSSSAADDDGDDDADAGPSPTTTTTTKTKTRSRSKEKTSTTTTTTTKPLRRSSSSSAKRKTAPPLLRSSDLASIRPSDPWIDLEVPPAELRPSATLTTGQCFSWTAVRRDDDDEQDDDDQSVSAWGDHDATEWVGAVGLRVFSIRETPSTTLYRRLLDNDADDADAALRDHLGLTSSSSSLADDYAAWSAVDPGRFGRVAAAVPGVRILRQDPWECLVSFTASSNNHIPRITSLLRRLREDHGERLLTIVPSGDVEPVHLHAFPAVERLRDVTEDDLRASGWGYRAKYLVGTIARLLADGGVDSLLAYRNVRALSDAEVRDDLVARFPGVGRKVADCVALFSLDRADAVPVDVHVWNLSARSYGFPVPPGSKSLTPRLYDEVGDLWRSVFPGGRAGHAHSVLFAAELPSFRSALPRDVLEEMDEWRKKEAARKAAVKAKKQANKKKKEEEEDAYA